MKNNIFLILFFFTLPVFGQQEAIRKARKLMERKQYESAVNLLDDTDPKNENPDVAVLKAELFLDYFVISMMHQLFAVTNLEKDQEILDVRGTEGNYPMFSFPIDSILPKLIKKHPEHYLLHKTLGKFYHEVHIKYGDNWLIPDQEVIQKMEKYYLEAYNHGVVDYWSAYGLGYYQLLNQNYSEAIPYLEKSVQMNPDFASGHYNLAYAYLYTNQHQKAIEEGEKALKMYNDPDLKADAARMIAVIFQELDEPERAWEYFLRSNEILSDNYYTLKPLVDLAVILNKPSKEKLTNDFFQLDPGNPTIYQDLMEIYWKSDKIDELVFFLDSQKKLFEANQKVRGNLHFYIALIHYNKEEYMAAKQNFEMARTIFREVFESDHQVFEVINSYTDEIPEN